MPKKKTEEKSPPPDKSNSDYFRGLVRECVAAYEKILNDGLALDYCKVSDRKLRAMILSDLEYQAETRNIYARLKFAEVEELEHLENLAAGGLIEDDDDEEDDYYEPRDGEKKAKKKVTSVDKDMLNMRFKAAQMKRELRAELSKLPGDNEQNTVNLMYVPITREEMEKLLTVELSAGSNDADFDELIGAKEEVPAGTAENQASKGKTKVPDDDTPDITVLENGEIVEN